MPLFLQKRVYGLCEGKDETTKPTMTADSPTSAAAPNTCGCPTKVHHEDASAREAAAAAFGFLRRGFSAVGGGRGRAAWRYVREVEESTNPICFNLL